MERLERLRVVVAVVCAATLALMPTAYASAQTPAASQDKPVDDTRVEVKAGTVDLHVQGASLRRVLQLLSTQSKTNIIASKEVTGTVTADLYGVTFEEALDAVLKVSGFEYTREGKFIYVMTAKERAERDAVDQVMSVKVFKLNYITAADAKALITPVLSKTGTVSVSPAAETGIGTSSSETGGNALATEDVIVVKDFPVNLKRVTEIIRELDVRPPQVLIEATILRATLDEDNALGVDFNALAGVDFRELSATSTGYSSLTLGAVPASRMDKGGGAVGTSFISGITPATGGLTMGFIFNEIAVFVRALESVSDVTVLANPKLLVMNKQRGEVIVGDRRGYRTTVVNEGISTETVEFLETGTQLVVRPYIASDKYVRLEIHPEDSSGSITDGLPTEETTECTSNILVRDGHTIVIGGLFREETNNNRSQIPGLGNIPGLGVIFRRRIEDTKRKEVIILITPHIIKHPVDEAVSEQMRDDIWRMRLGARQGLMWFGRDRLAHSHMRWAREHLANGNRRRALWDVKMALSLQPRLVEGLDLKERLTRQTIWATEPRQTSVDYVVQRMIMQELGQPFEKVAVPYKPRDGMLLEREIREALGIGERTEMPVPGLDEPRKRR